MLYFKEFDNKMLFFHINLILNKTRSNNNKTSIVEKQET